MDALRSAGGILLAGVLLCARAALAGGGHDHGHGGHHHDDAPGPHGGEVQELGDPEGTHVELIHDHAAGKTALHLVAKDGKSPVAIKDAPKINLKAKSGNKQIVMKAVNPGQDGAASHFEASDEGFKADPLDGRIAILKGGKQYNVKLDAHFGHGHGHGH